MVEGKEWVFETERLILREFREDDWPAIHEYGSDPQVVKYMPWGPNTEQDTKDFLQRELSHQKENPRKVYNFALVNRVDSQLIGACAISIRNVDNKEGEIGYVLNRQYWNQGHMTVAARAIVSFGFEKLGLHRIFATCHSANTGSYRIMEKIGMRREGFFKEHLFIKGHWRDSLLYSILEYEWRRREDGLSKNREVKIEYVEKNQDELDIIKPLWEKLLEHHKVVSRYFNESRPDANFETRKKQLLKNSQSGALHLDLVKDSRTEEYIGCCVTSLTAEKRGEIESIYVEKDYRGSGIGDQLMTKALSWLESNAVGKTILGVGEGNESVFAFYRLYNFYPRTTILERKPMHELKGNG